SLNETNARAVRARSRLRRFARTGGSGSSQPKGPGLRQADNARRTNQAIRCWTKSAWRNRILEFACCRVRLEFFQLQGSQVDTYPAGEVEQLPAIEFAK